METGFTPIVPLRSKAISLHNLEAIKREMRRVYCDVRSGLVDTQDGTRMVYILSQMAKIHEVAVLEKRVAQLEREPNEPN